MTTAVQLDDATFEKVCRLIYDNAGINLTEKKRALVQARVSKRIRKLHFSGFHEYFEYLENDKTGMELILLIDAISTNVIHFFREEAHFTLLESFLKEWEKKGRDRFRIWCAASSTGEEPYTLAIIAREALSNVSDTRVLATDISTEALQKAREGEYPPRALEKIAPTIVRRYFEPNSRSNTTAYRVKASLKRMIKFGRLNLSKPPFPLKGGLDVIFCRNVMIYFDNATRKPLIEEFYRLLRPGGCLFVGHSESLTAMMGKFKRIQQSVYRKQ